MTTHGWRLPLILVVLIVKVKISRWEETLGAARPGLVLGLAGHLHSIPPPLRC